MASMVTTRPRGGSTCTPAGPGSRTTDGTTSPCSCPTCPAVAAGMFTRSRFAGPSVVLSRPPCQTTRARGVVVLSRNANVATGETGTRQAAEVRDGVAARLGVPADELLIASTGVIGVEYPMAAVRAAIDDAGLPDRDRLHRPRRPRS